MQVAQVARALNQSIVDGRGGFHGRACSFAHEQRTETLRSRLYENGGARRGPCGARDGDAILLVAQIE
jgi:hypothetical protein